ncbi:MAG: regulator, partial [Flavobacteriaceae bacterium]|nr:regulator [Flavobacteriaceae bacterium]
FIKENSSLGGVAINKDLLVLNSVLGGVIICDDHGTIIQHIDLKKGLKNNTVLSSFIDTNNNLWLGLDNGISYLNINSPFTYFSSSLYLSSVYASATYKGVLYVATNQGVFYHKLNGKFKDDSFSLVEGTNSQSWNIQVIADELLCANNKGALVIKDNKVDKILDREGYYSFKEIPGHSGYFIGANYGGFAIFVKTPGGLVFRNRVEGLYRSSKDFELDSRYMWLKRDQFLYQLEFTSDLRSFIIKNKIINFNSNYDEINTLQKINDKLYFICNNHFYTYSDEFDAFQEDIHMSDLFSKVAPVNSIVQDSHKNLWYTYDQHESLGVFVKTDQNDYKNVVEPFSNLTGNFVTNYLSVNYIDNHNVFIGLINGLAHYDPDFITGYTTKPKVFIRSFSYTKDTIIQGNPQQKEKNIELPYKYNNVKFTFSSPEFESNDNILYSYRLEPFDRQWSNWSKEAIKEYTNLGEGDYTMKVKVRNSHGLASDEALFKFSVLPPWHRHYLAYIGYFLLLVLIAYLVRMRTKAKIREHKYYETIEQRKIYLEKESRIRMEQYQLEKKVEKLNRDKLKTSLLSKDKELVNNSLQVVKKNKILNGIVHKLKEMDTDSINDETKFQLNKLKKSITKEINNNGWKDLEKHIKNVHFDFLKRLKEKYPDISPRELDLSTYLLMNMSTKEIAESMNLSSGGVELARYRLRKKLGLNRKENLTGFLMNI